MIRQSTKFEYEFNKLSSQDLKEEFFKSLSTLEGSFSKFCEIWQKPHFQISISEACDPCKIAKLSHSIGKYALNFKDLAPVYEALDFIQFETVNEILAKTLSEKDLQVERKYKKKAIELANLVSAKIRTEQSSIGDFVKRLIAELLNFYSNWQQCFANAESLRILQDGELHKMKRKGDYLIKRIDELDQLEHEGFLPKAKISVIKMSIILKIEKSKKINEKLAAKMTKKEYQIQDYIDIGFENTLEIYAMVFIGQFFMIFAFLLFPTIPITILIAMNTFQLFIKRLVFVRCKCQLRNLVSTAGQSFKKSKEYFERKFKDIAKIKQSKSKRKAKQKKSNVMYKKIVIKTKFA